MKKRALIIASILFIAVSFTITLCYEILDQEVVWKWPEETYFSSLPVPSEKIDKMVDSKKNDTKTEYSVYVNVYDYTQFYDYITKLEKIGFNYEFYKDSVPATLDKLADKTETSWGANNGKIWIRALWRSNDNSYYNGYNLQLIINNYDYLKPIEN